jgi:hypothetical protein
MQLLLRYLFINCKITNMADVRKFSLAFSVMAITNELLERNRHVKFRTEMDHKYNYALYMTYCL